VIYETKNNKLVETRIIKQTQTNKNTLKHVKNKQNRKKKRFCFTKERLKSKTNVNPSIMKKKTETKIGDRRSNEKYQFYSISN
jgi:hypothetical protein